MNRASVAGWALWGAFVVTLGFAAFFGFNPPSGPPIRFVDALWAASFVGFPTAGALIVRRMPGRPLGWILLVAPLLLMLGVTLGDAARYFQDSLSVEPMRKVLWVATLCFGAGLAPLLTVPLYLPDGRLPSPRWRWVGRIVWAVAAVSLLHATLKPGPMEVSSSPASNPFGIESLGPLFDVIEKVLGPAFLMTLAIGGISLILRFRAARGVERQQMKWLVFGGGVLMGSFGSIALFEAVVGDLGDVAVTLLIVVAILSLPVSIAVAVLKTGLYEIDVVINRALVYAVLSGILGAAYLGLVVVFQRALDPITQQSDVAIAGSTLAVAALFRPVRSWVQTFIDRRFYRRKYDAAETLRAFSARLRDQVDLNSLSREVIEVVGVTMQPAHASLWLRAGADL